MNLKQTCLIIGCVVFFVAFVSTSSPLAAEYPSKPVTAILPVGVGGSTDVTARMLIEKLKVEFGQPIIVVNKKGGGGIPGMRYFLKQPADGYNVCVITNEPVQAAIAQGVEPIDPNDLSYVAGYMMQEQIAMAHKEAPYSTFQEFIAYAKKNPEKISIGSGGSVWALDIHRSIALKEGLKLNYVLFNSGADASSAFLGKHVNIAQTGVGTAAYQAARAGKANILVKLGQGKVPFFPNVPSAKALGYTKYEMNVPYGFLFHRDVPEEIRSKWEAALKKVLSNPEIITKMEKLGFLPEFIPGQKFKEFFFDTVSSSKELLEYVKPLK
jgi:tripartite-type tricarboxylate transporter receptor subunit TctC